MRDPTSTNASSQLSDQALLRVVGDEKMARRKARGPRAARLRSITSIRLCPDNQELYRPVDPSDPDLQSLTDSIRAEGIREPLVVTRDGYLLSGHRRLAAAQLAGLRRVPVRVANVSYRRNPERCRRLLVTFNRQRVKTPGELLAEEVVLADPAAAWADLRARRAAKDGHGSLYPPHAMIGGTERAARRAISAAKQGFLEAVRTIIRGRREFWPLSDRQVHYALLSDPPLRHALKPSSRYRNERHSYHDLCDVLTRARLVGAIPWQAIADEPRPFIHATGWSNAQTFIRQDLAQLFNGYYRRYQQSQPAHLEIVGEKLTVRSIVEPVASEFGVPLTIARGYPSIDPRRRIAERFQDSGKRRLVLLVASDFDPEGVDIGTSLVNSLRDDFDIDAADISAVRVAVTPAQVAELKLPPTMEAKAGSSRYAAFARQYGRFAYELEALPPETLQQALRDAIRSFMDLDLFDAELALEKRDAGYLAAVRARMLAALPGLVTDRDGGVP